MKKIEEVNTKDKDLILKSVSKKDYEYMTELKDDPIDLLTAHKQILYALEMGLEIPQLLIRNHNKSANSPLPDARRKEVFKYTPGYGYTD